MILRLFHVEIAGHFTEEKIGQKFFQNFFVPPRYPHICGSIVKSSREFFNLKNPFVNKYIVSHNQVLENYLYDIDGSETAI